MAHKQRNRVKDTWQILFGIEFVCLFVVCFVLFIRFWESDSNVCLRVFTKTSSIFLCRPANLNRPITDIFCCLTRLLPIYTLMFFFFFFLRWNLVSCVYIEIISYGRRFFSNWRGTAWYMYIRVCLHGGGGLQEGEVTRLGGVTRLSI